MESPPPTPSDESLVSDEPPGIAPPGRAARPGRTALWLVLGAFAVSIAYTAVLVAIAPKSRPRAADAVAATTSPAATAPSATNPTPAATGPTAATAGTQPAGAGPATRKPRRPPRVGGNNDALEWVSREDGPLEDVQMALWLASAGLAAVLAWRRRPGDARKVFVLFLFGALVVAAREADLHEAITPGSQHHPGVLGEWGVRFRGDWWRSTTAPVGPRVLWAAIGVTLAAVTVRVLGRATGPLLRPGSRYRALMPPLLVVAGLFFVGFGLDDLVRGRVPLRWSQVVEETLETVAACLFLGVVGWAARLSRADVASSRRSG
jgi:hypothetical protein